MVSEFKPDNIWAPLEQKSCQNGKNVYFIFFQIKLYPPAFLLPPSLHSFIHSFIHLFILHLFLSLSFSLSFSLCPYNSVLSVWTPSPQLFDMRAAVLVLLVGAASSSVEQSEWSAFKLKHAKSYANLTEELHRMKVGTRICLPMYRY